LKKENSIFHRPQGYETISHCSQKIGSILGSRDPKIDPIFFDTSGILSLIPLGAYGHSFPWGSKAHSVTDNCNT
jgi:hypothetical protein